MGDEAKLMKAAKALLEDAVAMVYEANPENAKTLISRGE